MTDQNAIEGGKTTVDPDRIALYLQRAGWARRDVPRRLVSVWTRKQRKGVVELLVPVASGVADYMDRIDELLETLVNVEGRTSEDLALELELGGAHLIKFEIDRVGRGPNLVSQLVDAATEVVVTAARFSFLAEGKGVFDARIGARAGAVEDFLSSVAIRGLDSAELSVVAALPSSLANGISSQTGLRGLEVARVVLTTVRDLRDGGVDWETDDDHATAVAEAAAALASLASTRDVVRARFLFVPSTTEPQLEPEEVILERPSLDRVAHVQPRRAYGSLGAYRAPPPPEVLVPRLEMTAQVVGLARPRVTFRGIAEGRRRNVQAKLYAGDYARAIDAHASERLVFVAGTAIRRGSSLRFRQVHEFGLGD